MKGKVRCSCVMLYSIWKGLFHPSSHLDSVLTNAFVYYISSLTGCNNYSVSRPIRPYFLSVSPVFEVALIVVLNGIHTFGFVGGARSSMGFDGDRTRSVPSPLHVRPHTTLTLDPRKNARTCELRSFVVGKQKKHRCRMATSNIVRWTYVRCTAPGQTYLHSAPYSRTQCEATDSVQLYGESRVHPSI